MTTNQNLPKTLIEAVQYFSDTRVCVEFVKNLHWPDGNVTCPRCNSTHVKELSTRQIWKCYGCKKQFSVKVGTIFEKSPLSLTKWLPCLWLAINAKNGISSCEVARSLGVCQKTAWFMMHRIREAMRNGAFVKLMGRVEVDETYIGGREENKHLSKRTLGFGPSKDKTAVMGMVERGGNVISKVINNSGSKVLQGNIRSHISKDAMLYTDQHKGYSSIGYEYLHLTVNHSEKEYVRGNVHTNTIEGFFGLLKRCVKGTYIHMAPFHLDRYLDEQCLRYNLRKGTDGSRFKQVASQVVGRRLTWNELTGKVTD